MSEKMFLTIKRNSLVKIATNVLFGIDIPFLEMSIINSQGCNSLSRAPRGSFFGGRSKINKTAVLFDCLATRMTIRSGHCRECNR